MKTVDRRTDLPAIESCVYRALSRDAALDSSHKAEAMRAAAIGVLGNLAAHLQPGASGAEAVLHGQHRVTLVHGNLVRRQKQKNGEKNTAKTRRKPVKNPSKTGLKRGKAPEKPSENPVRAS